MNLLSLIYVVSVQPFESRFLNNLNVINEAIGLLVAYHMLPLQDLYYSPGMHHEIGEFIVYTFYLSGIVNITLTLGVAIKDAIRKIRQMVFKCK